MKFMTMPEALFYHAQLHPDKMCIADARGEVTYRQYWKRICGAAGRLAKAGLTSGRCVVAKASQAIEFLVCAHAVQLAGGVFVPLEKTAGEERIREIYSRTNALFYIGDAPAKGTEFIPMAELAGFEADDPPCAMPEPEADSMILFTTGTTGVSKGIMLKHASETAVAENVMVGVEMTPDNVEIIPMPVNHSYGLRRYFANMLCGASVVLMDGVVFAKRFFDMTDKYHATAAALAPAALAIIFRMTGDRIGEYNKQFSYIQFGSAPLPEADKERLLRLLPDCRLYNLYGTTEAGCSCILNFNSADNRENCIGRPTCNSRFMIVDDDGKRLDSSKDRIGHLVCAGTMNMKGYFGDPELTEAAMKDGYIRSNDIGYIDDTGLIYMLGRVDDVINTGGNKIAPGEIEEVARRFPGVSDCACAAMNDPVMGQIPILYIVADKALTTDSLFEYLAEKLDGFKLPKAIEQIPEIPRTYNGKILRSQLRKQANTCSNA